MGTDRRDSGFNLLGVAAASCIACCAGPLLAFLGAVGLAGVLATLVVGVTAVVVAAVVVAVVLARRRQRPVACAWPGGTEEVGRR